MRSALTCMYDVCSHKMEVNLMDQSTQFENTSKYATSAKLIIHLHRKPPYILRVMHFSLSILFSCFNNHYSKEFIN